MLSVSNLSIQFGKRVLFDNVNTSFNNGNCYGIIGANGAGKSTFLKILSGKIDPTSGHVHLESGKRMSVLEQDHRIFDDNSVLETVIMGDIKLYEIKKEIDFLYENYSDENAEKIGSLQVKFEEMDGWNAESNAASLLSNLGIKESLHQSKMSDVDPKLKVRILLAKSLFGNPDVLVMDEPTNDLDYETISWLEEYLANFDNCIIVVSHDRHFLDSVCTHISDIDFGKINHYSGNYTFWYESSQLAARQRAQQNKKAEEKKKELEEFIARFSANVAKSKQATSRKKMIEKLDIQDIKPSSRRYPGIIFEMERESGDQILSIDNLKFEGINSPLSFILNKNDKVVLYSKDSKISTKFYEVINGLISSEGSFSWGSTIKTSYLPLNNDHYFNENINLVDWLRQWSTTDEEREEVFIRGFLGKMLFSGEEALKSCKVLSGGEKVRCILSKMMMERSNFLMLDEPTNHLDLETIQTLNNSLIKFKGNLIVSTHDFEFANSIGNRIIEIGPNGFIDKLMSFEDFLTDKKVEELRNKIY